ANRGPDVVPYQLDPAPGARRVVETKGLLTMRVRLAQLTQIEMREHRAAVSEDLHIDFTATGALGQQSLRPGRRLSYSPLRERADPHPPQPDQEASRLCLCLGQANDRSGIH